MQHRSECSSPLCLTVYCTNIWIHISALVFQFLIPSHREGAHLSVVLLHSTGQPRAVIQKVFVYSMDEHIWDILTLQDKRFVQKVNYCYTKPSLPNSEINSIPRNEKEVSTSNLKFRQINKYKISKTVSSILKATNPSFLLILIS